MNWNAYGFGKALECWRSPRIPNSVCANVWTEERSCTNSMGEFGGVADESERNLKDEHAGPWRFTDGSQQNETLIWWCTASDEKRTRTNASNTSNNHSVAILYLQRYDCCSCQHCSPIRNCTAALHSLSPVKCCTATLHSVLLHLVCFVAICHSRFSMETLVYRTSFYNVLSCLQIRFQLFWNVCGVDKVSNVSCISSLKCLSN